MLKRPPDGLALAVGDMPGPLSELAPDEPGHILLDDVAAFIATFVSFPSRAALTAGHSWVAHTHLR